MRDEDVDGNHGAEIPERIVGRMIATRDDVGWQTLVGTMCSAMELIQETCAIMVLPHLARIARAITALLQRLHDAEVEPTPAMLGEILAAVDVIEGRISLFGDSGQDTARDDSALVARLASWRTPVSIAPGDDAAAAAGGNVAEMNAMLLDEIRERICELALVAHYLNLFPWHGGRRTSSPDGG